MRFFRAGSLSLLVIVAAYAPAFALVGFLHVSVNDAVPAIIGVSFGVAGILALAYALWRHVDWSAFGIRWPAARYLGWAFAASVPLSVLAELLINRVHEAGPLSGLTLSPAVAAIYFLVLASVQEEFIFRGLIQGIFAREAGPIVAMPASALLFALLHLAVGPVTALSALILGLLAGELRRRSGSLLPAILCHAIFNFPGVVGL